MAKKKSTADILAQMRAQDSGKKEDAPEDVAPADVKSESEQPEAKQAAAAQPQAAPKSTKDILARLRAEAAGGGKSTAPADETTAAAKPAVKKTAPAKEAVAAVPDGEKPSVQEMLKAVRGGETAQQPSVEAVAKADAKPEGKPVRGKPAALRKSVERREAGLNQGRRNVLVACLLAPVALVSSPFAAAWTFFSTAAAAFSLAVARFMMPNVLVEPPSQFKVGSPSDYPAGTVTTKWKSEFGVWIVHTEFRGKSIVYALFSICTHLGCTPNWLEAEQKFKCPCHGSGFYISGVNFEGPAPRPLERTAIRIAPDGMLEVDKSRKFQKELGQWDDPASFVELA